MLIYFINALVVWVLFGLIFSWLGALSYPMIDALVKQFPVQKRLNWRLFHLLSPLMIASLAVFLLSQPELIKVVVAGHCHDELCAPHWLHIDNAKIESQTLILMSLLFTSFVIYLILRQLRVSKRYLTLLGQLSVQVNSEKMNGPEYRVIETDKAIAWCAGLLNPQVFLSKALVNQVSTAELNLILKHEYTHAIRRDNFRKWLIYWCSWCWPKALKIKVRQTYLYDTELVCDLSAIIHSAQIKELTCTVEHALQLASCHCQSANENHKTATIRQLDVEHEILLNQQFKKGRYGLLLLLMGLINLVILFAALHFGHPFLEWISS